MRHVMVSLFACALVSMAMPAMAGPAFAYSWLSTDRPFDRCMQAAKDIMSDRAYDRVQTTRFGVTGETGSETLYVNCEDHRHISVVLMRTERPGYGEIDALVAQMQQRLDATD